MAWRNYNIKGGKLERDVRNKLNAHKVTVDGITYDSRKEARRHKELMLLQKAGEIHSLQRQVKFVLIPAQREPATYGPKGGKKPGKLLERECAYIADFYYKDQEDHEIVEDVKGYRGGATYEIFVIKRKLMLFVYGIRVREV